MPKFQGSAEDRAALSAYLVSLHGDTITAGDILAMVAEAETGDTTSVTDSSAVMDTSVVTGEMEESK